MAIFSSKYTGSFQTTASFGRVDIDENVTAKSFTGIFEGALSSSAQISDDISGSFVAPSSSFSTRTTDLETASASFSTRISTEESNVDNLQARQIISGVGLKDGGDLTADRTLNIDFSDSTFQTGISGSFTEASSSLATRVTTAEGSVAALQSDSASFSTRVSNNEATSSKLDTASGSFSTRVTNLKADSGSFSTRITTEESNIDTLQTRTLTAGTGLSGGGNLTDDRTFNIDFSDSDLQTGISGSLGPNATTIRSLTKAGISGSFTKASASFSTRVTNLKTDSGSFSTRVSTNESLLNQSVKSDASPRFAGLTVDGRIVTQELFVSSSVVSMSVRQASGSTIFGDDLGDTHLFTGSLSITGSISSNGLPIISSSAMIADDISGSFTAASSSFSTRVSQLKTDSGSFSTRITTEEANVDALQARQIISGVGLKDGGDLTADRTLNIDFSDSTFASGISGSFTKDSASLSSRITTNEAASASFSTRITTEEGNVDTLQARNISTGLGLTGGGDLTSDRTLAIDFSDNTFASGISGSLGPNAATIRSLTKAGITGSFTQASASFSTRVTTEEANVDALQARQIISGVGLKDGGDLTADRTLNIDFSDSTFQTGISGSFTSTSASIASDIKEFKDGTVTLVSGSGASTGSFGKLLGDGSDLTGVGGFPFTGSAGIKGSLIVDGKIESNASISGSTISASSIQATTIDIDSISGNWTNTGNTVADLGTITTVDINGGTIDGTTIATSNINLTGQTLTLDNDQISGDKVEGGTIAATTITSLTSTNVISTNVTASSALSSSKLDTGEIKLDGTTITATATEINFLSGVTSDVKEAYDTVAYATDTGIITFTEIDGGTDTIDIGVGTGDSPSFTGLTVSGLTNSKLLGVNGSGVVGEKDLNDFVAGTANRISVVDDSDGTITLSTPQDIATTSNVTFNQITGSGNISGSGTSTGSFGRVETQFVQARNIRTRRFRGFSPLAFDDSINITGSIDFKDGHLSGSATSTGSFGTVFIPNQKNLQFGSISTRIRGDNSNNNLTFHTNNTERVRIDDNGMGIGGDPVASNGLTIHAVNPGLTLRTSNTTGAGKIRFADTGDADIGLIEYGHSTNAMVFSTGDAEAFRLDTNQNAILGGNISGSATSTGSFGRVDSPEIYVSDPAGIYADKIRRYTDSSTTTKIVLNDEVIKLHAGSASDETLYLSGNVISGSSTSTGSFGHGFIGSKLGIGTTSPGYQLVVEDAGDTDVQIRASSSGRARLRLHGNSDIPEIYFAVSDSNKSAIYQSYDGNTLGVWSFANNFTIMSYDLANNRVGIGIDSPDGRLHVHSGTAGTMTAHTSADDLVVENNDHGGISILTPNNKNGGIFFGDVQDNNIGMLVYNHSTNRFEITVGASSAPVLGINSNTAEFGSSIVNISGSASSTGSFGLDEAANCIESAIDELIESGIRTKDISLSSENFLSTQEMGDKIVSKILENE